MTKGEHALDRSARLIAGDIFQNSISNDDVIAGLLGTTARIFADEVNLDTPNGQTALVTLFTQLSMMGISVDLSIPRVKVIPPQPPLGNGDLETVLREYADDLIPGLRSPGHDEYIDIVYVMGDTKEAGNESIRVWGTESTASTAPAQQHEGIRWHGDWALAAIAAGATGAGEGLRAAVHRLTDLTGETPNREFDYDIGRPSFVDLKALGTPEQCSTVGAVDMISGGAITNAALYTLLRVPSLTGQIRVIEPDIVDMTNLNRYPLSRRSDIGLRKIDVLSWWSSDSLRITGLPVKFKLPLSGELSPMAPTVLVGADQIPVRWDAQRLEPSSLCIGATSHFFATVSSHVPGKACAGCSHARDERGNDPIPTISFVSLWAGLLQAIELLGHAGGFRWESRFVHCYPLGLAHPKGIVSGRQGPNHRCPLHCRALQQHQQRGESE